MSIPLTQLIGLSHDLYHGRKRRYEWEQQAERRCRMHWVTESVAASAQPRAAEAHMDTAAEDKPLSEALSEEDRTEMRLLVDALAARGLAVREAAAERAMMRLLLADASRPAAPKGAARGCDFGWLVGEEAAPSVPVKLRFQYVEGDGEVNEMRLHEALQRLLTLIKEPTRGQDLDSEDSDNEDVEAEALVELSREFMQEAEWEELALTTNAPSGQECPRVTPPLASTSSATGSPIPTLSDSKSNRVTPALAPCKASEENAALQKLALTDAMKGKPPARAIPHL